MRIFGQENITKLVKQSSSVVSLPAGSRVHLGGSSYDLSVLTVDTSVIGLGGLESTLTINTFYYVYAVLNSGVVSLIATTSSIKPNFEYRRKFGAFFVDNNSEILESRFYGSDIVGAITSFDLGYSGTNMSVATVGNHDYQMTGSGVQVNGFFGIPTVNTNSAYLVMPKGLIKGDETAYARVYGQAIRMNVAEINNAHYAMFNNNSQQNTLYLTRIASTNSSPLVVLNWNDIISNGQNISYEYEIPVAGWPTSIDWNLY